MPSSSKHNLTSPEPVALDMVSHHALGGGSYAFGKDFPSYLLTLMPNDTSRVEVNIIIQPNSSPHIGTLCSTTLAFVVAEKIKTFGLKVLVVCDLWDNAKGDELEIGGVRYQRSLRCTGKLNTYLPEYEHLLSSLSERYDIPYRLRFEEVFLSQAGIPEVVRGIIQDREYLAKVLGPLNNALGLRAACPKCGLVDKYGIHNEYADDGSSATFTCPSHGKYSIDVNTQSSKFHFNCQLFNLVLGRFYQNVDFGYVQICGSDYAGFWQEQLLWRHLEKPIIIVYTPLINDWSGSKISKSLYLRGTAYDYLKRAGQEYLVSYAVFRKEQKDLGVICAEVELWVNESYRLFRAYSLHYMHLLFQDRPVTLGIIHSQ